MLRKENAWEEPGRAAWRFSERDFPQNAMCSQEHVHNVEDNAGPQHLKCTPMHSFFARQALNTLVKG